MDEITALPLARVGVRNLEGLQRLRGLPITGKNDTDTEAVLAEYLQGCRRVKILKGDSFWNLGQQFAACSSYRLADVPYASSFAGFKDWFIQNFKRPGYTVEVGSGSNPLPTAQFPEIFQDNLGILMGEIDYAVQYSAKREKAFDI